MTSAGAVTLTSTGSTSDITATAGADVVFKPTNTVVSENAITSTAGVAKGDLLYMHATTGLTTITSNATITHIAGIAAAQSDAGLAVKLAGMPGSTVSALTTGMTVGDVAYVGTDGVLTTTMPVAGNVIRVGIVTAVGAVGTGRILFQPEFKFAIA